MILAGSDIYFMDFEVVDFWDFLELWTKDVAFDVALEVASEYDVWNGHVLEAWLYPYLIFANGNRIRVVDECFFVPLFWLVDTLLVGYGDEEGRRAAFEDFGESYNAKNVAWLSKQKQANAFSQVCGFKGGLESVVVALIFSEDHLNALHFPWTVVFNRFYHKLFAAFRGLNHWLESEEAQSIVGCWSFPFRRK